MNASTKNHESTLQVPYRPLVSALIVTREREQILTQCVAAILESTYRNIEIVIVDNGTLESSRKIDDFITSLSTDIPIKHLHVKPQGFAQLRQLGTNATKGEIIVSVDDDCILVSSNISEIVSIFASDPTIGIVGGNISNIGFGDKEQFKGRGKIGVNGRYETVEDPYQADVFGSANMSFRRSAFERAGGYDDFFKGGLEEADLTYAIKRAGFRMVYAPQVRVMHYHVPSRFRNPTRNLNTLRIYFYLKYFPPKSLRAWGGFIKNELKLALENFMVASTEYRKSIGPNFPQNVKKTIKVLYIFWQITVARIKIPYLLYRTRRPKFTRHDNT